MGPDHPYTTAAKEGLANVLSDEKRYAEAETLLRQILTQRQRILGTEHTDTLFSQYNLATVLKHENRYEEAETLMRGTLEAQARVLDAGDPDTLASRSLLADILLREQRPQEAEVFAGGLQRSVTNPWPPAPGHPGESQNSRGGPDQHRTLRRCEKNLHRRNCQDRQR